MAKFQLKASELHRGLSNVLLAASKDKARPVLCGVSLSWREGLEEIRLECTNGYLLIREELDLEHREGEGAGAVVLELGKEVVSLLKKASRGGTAIITVDPHSATFEAVGFGSVVVPLLVDRFPDTEKLWGSFAPAGLEELIINGEWLTVLGKVDSGAGKGSEAPALMPQAGGLAAVHVLWGGPARVSALVMPTRGGEGRTARDYLAAKNGAAAPAPVVLEAVAS